MTRFGTVIALVALTGATACGKLETNTVDAQGNSRQVSQRQQITERDRNIRRACASATTYDRLKELAFDEARRVRNAESRNLEQLAAASVVRMEQPLVKSRDEALNVTVCTGRLILELPPGIAPAFGGQQRLIANVEYAAQAAADGSGLVYQMDGAEPIIYRLAAFDLRQARGRTGAPDVSIAANSQPPVTTDPMDTLAPDIAAGDLPPPVTQAAPPRPRTAPATPEVRVRPRPAPPPEVARVRPAPAPPRAQPAPVSTATARPSFNCRYARSRVEQMICSNDRLAGQDRRMASLFYSALAAAGPESKRDLQRTRNAFVRARDTCLSEACVADSYDERIAELREWND